MQRAASSLSRVFPGNRESRARRGEKPYERNERSRPFPLSPPNQSPETFYRRYEKIFSDCAVSIRRTSMRQIARTNRSKRGSNTKIYCVELYLLISDRLLKKHHIKNQFIGTGYVRSKNCLFRELNRGVEWIFSNHALELQSICNSLLELRS